jgi:hypothetical protein
VAVTDNHDLRKDGTPRFNLRYGVANQDLPRAVVNDALFKLDMIQHAQVEARSRQTPPGSPAEAECYLLHNTTLFGDFAYHFQWFAGWYNGLWRFIPPRKGMRVWVKADSIFRYYDGANWVPMPTPSG